MTPLLKRRVCQWLFIICSSVCWGIPQSFDLLSLSMGGTSTALAGGGSARRATVEGLFQNPAGIAAIKNGQAILLINPYLAGTTLWGIGSTLSLGAFTTVGASGYGIFLGDFHSDPNDSLLKNVDSVAAVAGFSLGFSLGEFLKIPIGLDLGVTARLAHMRLSETSLTSVSGDFGVLAVSPKFFNSQRVLASMVFRNLGPKVGSEVLPFEWMVGARYELETRYFGASLMADFKENFDQDPSFSLSSEISFLQFFAVRGGYRFGHSPTGFSLGGGAKIHFGELKLELDYTIVPFDQMGFEHSIQAVLSFPLAKSTVSSGPRSDQEASEATLHLPPSSPAKNPRIGIVVSSKLGSLFDREALKELKSAWKNFQFDDGCLVLAKEYLDDKNADPVVMTQLAKKLQFDKLVIVESLSSLARGVNLLMFDPLSKTFEKTLFLNLPEEESLCRAALGNALKSFT